MKSSATHDATKAITAAWAYILGDRSQFPANYDVIAMAAALGRTDWIAPASAFGSLSFYTTGAFEAISRLVDFELARMELDD